VGSSGMRARRALSCLLPIAYCQLPIAMSFHDTRFPTGISRAASGGPERRTDVVALGSGAEERNARWADSRHSYNAGYGVKSLNDLHAVIAFFEERRGRLHGFRWRDPTDWKSCPPEAAPTALDQDIGLGDGLSVLFQLSKPTAPSSIPGPATSPSRSLAPS